MKYNFQWPYFSLCLAQADCDLTKWTSRETKQSRVWSRLSWLLSWVSANTLSCFLLAPVERYSLKTFPFYPEMLSLVSWVFGCPDRVWGHQNIHCGTMGQHWQFLRISNYFILLIYLTPSQIICYFFRLAEDEICSREASLLWRHCHLGRSYSWLKTVWWD